MPARLDRRTRLTRHSSHPDDCAGKLDGGQEVDRSAVVARGDAPEVFELVEEALDAVPEPVGDRIMRDLDLARAGRGNDRLGFSLGDQLAQGVAFSRSLAAAKSTTSRSPTSGNCISDTEERPTRPTGRWLSCRKCLAGQ